MKTERITTSGESIETTPANGCKFTLGELQNIVGGYIELHTVPDGRLMVMNEEGALLGLPANPVATVIASNLETGPRGITGDVLLCDPTLID